jgi:hypothetical protein
MSQTGGRSTGWQRAARLKRSREEAVVSACKFIKSGAINSTAGRVWTAAFFQIGRLAEAEILSESTCEKFCNFAGNPVFNLK